MTKEIPILFRAPMVRAILEGRKTQTRRTRGLEGLMKVPEMADDYEFREMRRYDDGSYRAIFDSDDEPFSIKSPYGGPGDLLFVRENTWTHRGYQCGVNDATLEHGKTLFYQATDPQPDKERFKSRPSIHMPKAAARIWLRNKGVKVERVKDISRKDAIAEGVEPVKRFEKQYPDVCFYRDYRSSMNLVFSPRISFATLWHSVNGAESWLANPWVWVVEFERVER